MDKEIKFEDFFNLNGLKDNGEDIKPEQVKVKFNMNNDNGENTQDAIQLLFHNEELWLRMLEYYKKKSPHNYGNAKYVLTFAQYPELGRNYFVFGGMYKIEVLGTVEEGIGYYKLTLINNFSMYRKRVVIKTKETIGQAINRTYQNVASKNMGAIIFQILPLSAVGLGSFPGYSNVLLNFEQLKNIQNFPEWSIALSSVKGIYCITDKENGQLYIGSATGKNGILGRWTDYIKNYNGGNKSLTGIEKGHIENFFQYSILEVFDTKTRQEDILRKEYHWMKVFQTVTKGYNNSASRGKFKISHEENDIKTEQRILEENRS